MIEEITARVRQAEARSERTRSFIRAIKRITRRKFTSEEKIRIAHAESYETGNAY